jgi:hypothetical protein
MGDDERPILCCKTKVLDYLRHPPVARSAKGSAERKRMQRNCANGSMMTPRDSDAMRVMGARSGPSPIEIQEAL